MRGKSSSRVSRRGGGGREMNRMQECCHVKNQKIRTSWQLKHRKSKGCLAYLVCPLKPTCIAECPWSIWPTSHCWCAIFTHTTMATLSRTNNPKKKSSRKKHWSLDVIVEAVAVTRGWSTKSEKKCKLTQFQNVVCHLLQGYSWLNRS